MTDLFLKDKDGNDILFQNGNLKITDTAWCSPIMVDQNGFLLVDSLKEWLSRLVPDGLRVQDRETGKRYVVTEIVE